MRDYKVSTGHFECDRTCTLFQECRFTSILRYIGRTRVFSHITKVDIEIRDLDALAAACAKRGLQLRLGQRTYKWFGRSVGDYPLPAGVKESDLGKCTHAIHLNKPGAYEIGVVAQSDGTFRLVWDFWSGGYGLRDVVGDDCKTLVGDYTIEAARNAANAQNWISQDNSDGTLTIFHPEGGTFTVNRDGTVESAGFSGTGCDAASAIEQALGKEKDRTNKSEYYEQRARIKQS